MYVNLDDELVEVVVDDPSVQEPQVVVEDELGSDQESQVVVEDELGSDQDPQVLVEEVVVVFEAGSVDVAEPQV